MYSSVKDYLQSIEQYHRDDDEYDDDDDDDEYDDLDDDNDLTLTREDLTKAYMCELNGVIDHMVDKDISVENTNNIYDEDWYDLTDAEEVANIIIQLKKNTDLKLLDDFRKYVSLENEKLKNWSMMCDFLIDLYCIQICEDVCCDLCNDKRNYVKLYIMDNGNDYTSETHTCLIENDEGDSSIRNISMFQEVYSQEILNFFINRFHKNYDLLIIGISNEASMLINKN